MTLADEMKAETKKALAQKELDLLEDEKKFREEVAKAAENGKAWAVYLFEQAIPKIRECAQNGETSYSLKNVCGYPDEKYGSREYEKSLAFYKAEDETLKTLFEKEGFTIKRGSYTRHSNDPDDPSGTEHFLVVKWD